MVTRITKRSLIGAALGLVAIVGVAAGCDKQEDAAMTPSSADTSTAMTVPTTDTKAADLRVLLGGMEKEHVALAAAATRAGFDGRSAEFQASAAELDKNSVALSKTVGSVYGADAEKKFLEIWRSHITFFVNYTVAAQKGDKAGMDKAVADLGGYADAIADFFSGANPNLPRAAVKSLVLEHVTLLKAAVDAHGSGNSAESFAKQHAAHEQIGQISDAISGAIVKQHPESFK